MIFLFVCFLKIRLDNKHLNELSSLILCEKKKKEKYFKLLSAFILCSQQVMTRLSTTTSP